MNDMTRMQTADDRLAYLDAERVSIIFGTHLAGAEIEYQTKSHAWHVWRFKNKQSEHTDWPTLREAIDHIQRDPPFIAKEPPAEMPESLYYEPRS